MLIYTIFNDIGFKGESLSQLSINMYSAELQYYALMINLPLQTSSPR